MREGDLVRLDVGLQKMRDPFEFIEQRATGKRILNVGAGGGVQLYLPSNKDVWLHERLRRCADELIGVDIDEDSIEYAAAQGYTILNENCETMALNKQFDLIVMSDVIEHVNAPVTAIDNLLAHLADDGLLIITTPNINDYDNQKPAVINLSLRGDQTGIITSTLGLDETLNPLLTPEGKVDIFYGYTSMGGEMTYRTLTGKPTLFRYSYPEKQRLPQLYVTAEYWS